VLPFCPPAAFIAGAGPDGSEFIIYFDYGKASEFKTLLLTDWVAYTPPEILAANFGVPADAFSKNAQPLDFPGPGAWQPAGRPRRLRP
jgi:hypothetical protein